MLKISSDLQLDTLKKISSKFQLKPTRRLEKFYFSDWLMVMKKLLICYTMMVAVLQPISRAEEECSLEVQLDTPRKITESLMFQHLVV